MRIGSGGSGCLGIEAHAPELPRRPARGRPDVEVREVERAVGAHRETLRRVGRRGHVAGRGHDRAHGRAHRIAAEVVLLDRPAQHLADVQVAVLRERETRVGLEEVALDEERAVAAVRVGQRLAGAVEPTAAARRVGPRGNGGENFCTVNDAGDAT